MKIVLKIVGVLLLALLLIGAVGFGWAKFSSGQKLARDIDTHTVDFPIPYPLSDEEAAEVLAAADGESVDLEAVALERALERGKHLVEARYVCVECHGNDFSGGVMVDDPMLGSLLGPNITLKTPTGPTP